MRDGKHWDGRYTESEIPPWDTGYPDSHLMKTISEQKITPCTALEIGCGTGTNAFWLESQGFKVTAGDISEIAITIAKKKASELNSNINFLINDFLRENIPGGPFSFAFDRGCFHSFKLEEERSDLAERVSSYLDGDGLWLNMSGSCDSPPRETGPPMLTAESIITTVEPFFEILKLEAGFFDSKQKAPAKAWICLLKKRVK